VGGAGAQAGSSTELHVASDRSRHRYALEMPAGKQWRSLATEPLTRYQVRLIPAVLVVAVGVWLIAAAFVAGHWLAGTLALVVALAWGYSWVIIRGRRLRRAMVLPPSARSERRAARREERSGRSDPEDDPRDISEDR
jgi:small-conductance mechanosensitive channel